MSEKNILFSGFSYSKENFELMKKVLADSGIGVIDFGPYNLYQNMSDSKLVQSVCQHFDEVAGEGRANIICQSMGCNIGLILAKERAGQIKKAVFMSPELQKASRTDKRIAKLRDESINDDLMTQKQADISLFDKLKLYKVFKQTKKLALEKTPPTDSLVIYGVADKFVSGFGAEKLAGELNAYVLKAMTGQHNVLLSRVGSAVATEIAKFLNEELEIDEKFGGRPYLKKYF